MKVIYFPTGILHFRTNYACLVLGTLKYEFDRLFDVFGSDVNHCSKSFYHYFVGRESSYLYNNYSC